MLANSIPAVGSVLQLTQVGMLLSWTGALEEWHSQTCSLPGPRWCISCIAQQAAHQCNFLACAFHSCILRCHC